MGLILKDAPPRDMAPEGQHVAVCVDVIDLGIVDTTYKNQKKTEHKCRIVYEIGEINPKTDAPFTIGRRFTVSLYEKAALRKFLESWRGRGFTREELGGFDTEKLIGVNAMIQIVHTVNGDKTYDDINSIMKAHPSMAKATPSGKYIRVKDRANTNGQKPAEVQQPVEEVPF